MNPFLYAANLVGYLRIVLMVVAFYMMQKHNPYTVLVYGVSCLLDAIDGTLARAFNQCSRFGAVLDMVTDRSSTCGLLVFLSTLFPERWIIAFQLLIALDISSHYMVMFCSLCTKQASHKSVASNYPWILRLYYGSKLFLFFACIGNEAFLLSLYLYKTIPKYGFILKTNDMLTSCALYTAYLTFPIFVFKQIANVVQLAHSSAMLVQLEYKEKSQ